MSRCLRPASQPERARARRVLREAVVAGRIDPAAVAQAVAEGDSGVAALFQAHATMPTRARLTTYAIDLRAMDSAPDHRVLAGLARLIETLTTDGDLTRKALATVPSLSARELAACLNTAWVRRVARVTRGLRRMLSPNCVPAGTHFVYPAALLHLINPHAIQSEGQDSGEFEADAVIGLNQEGFLWVGSEADALDEKRALRVAWDEVVRCLQVGTLNPFGENGHFVYALESLSDLGLTCEWEGEEPLVHDDQLAAIAEDPHDDDLQRRMRAYLQEMRAFSEQRPWARRGKAFLAWRAARAGTPAGERVERLLALARWRRALDLKERLRVSCDDEGTFSIAPVHRADAFGERLIGFIDEEHNQLGSASLRVARQIRSSLSLGQVLDALIADAALAGAVRSLMCED